MPPGGHWNNGTSDMKTDWSKALTSLIRKYKSTKHPLEYKNLYQLMVMVVLSAQSTDKYINELAPKLFKAFASMKSLAKASPQKLYPFIGKVRNFRNKANWLVKMAKQIGDEKKMQLDLEHLTELPGIGVKSASVILREMGKPAEAVMVDLHTVRVANRLGIVKTEDPSKIEKELRKILPASKWEAGMSMSFLGREICRPKPLCPICLMKKVCAYYHEVFLKEKGKGIRDKG
jgi:endonuclease-3